MSSFASFSKFFNKKFNAQLLIFLPVLFVFSALIPTTVMAANYSTINIERSTTLPSPPPPNKII